MRSRWSIKPNSQYNLARPDSLPARTAAHQRRKMYEMFLRTFGLVDNDSLTILDVGATSDRTYSSSNYLEAWYPRKDRITACGIDDASFLETLYPGVRFVAGNGRDLPFANDEFDIVHSSAVLEHVGSRENQVQFIHQCARVARRGVFLTTPTRWFPVEFHTLLPLVHWLPNRYFRRLLKGSAYDFFAEEKNLNLLTARELRSISNTVNTGAASFDVRKMRLLGWPANLILVGTKT